MDEKLLRIYLKQDQETIDTLRATIERLKADCAAVGRTYNEQEAENDALRAEVERLQKEEAGHDAECDRAFASGVETARARVAELEEENKILSGHVDAAIEDYNDSLARIAELVYLPNGKPLSQELADKMYAAVQAATFLFDICNGYGTNELPLDWLPRIQAWLQDYAWRGGTY